MERARLVDSSFQNNRRLPPSTSGTSSLRSVAWLRRHFRHPVGRSLGKDTSCNQKRLLLFSEHLSENVLLKLPHRQFVFTLPKLLRVYFKYDRNLFEEVSKIIFSIIHDYYIEAVKTTVKTGVIVSYQSFGDLMRWNPHFHCIVEVEM